MPHSARTLSLRATALAYVLAFLVALGTAGVFLYGAALRGIDNAFDMRLRSETSELIVGSPDQAELAVRIARREKIRSTPAIGIMLVDARGHRVAGSLHMRVPALGLSDVDYTDGLRGLEGLDGGRSLATRRADGSTLVIVADSDPVNYTERLIVEILVVGFLVSGLIVGAGMLSLSNTMRTRMRAVRATAEAIMDGDMTRRLSLSGRGGELDDEARTLNHMLDRIAGLLENLRHMSDDVAHDLRTPLMRLRHRLTDMATQSEASVLQGEAVHALAECDEILALFAAILRLSEIESGARRAGFAPVAFDALVSDVVSGFAPAVEVSGRSLAILHLDRAVIRGDRVLLSQMLVNLVENAAEHTPPGTRIVLALRDCGDGIALSVADDGPGVPAEARVSVLRRFARLDGSRSSKGHGLGLTLVDAIARLHGGAVTLGDSNAELTPPGLSVTIFFPTAPSSKIQSS